MPMIWMPVRVAVKLVSSTARPPMMVRGLSGLAAKVTGAKLTPSTALFSCPQASLLSRKIWPECPAWPLETMDQ